MPNKVGIVLFASIPLMGKSVRNIKNSIKIGLKLPSDNLMTVYNGLKDYLIDHWDLSFILFF